MASEAQIQANRSNAQKSTGPRTAEGKAVVGQNAVKHGLCARQAVIAGEDLGEYEFYRDQMLGELAPEGAMESVLAQRAVGLAWRLQRAERLQNEAFDALYAEDTTGPFARLAQSLRSKEQARLDPAEKGRDLTLGRVVVKDFANARVLDRLLMYERRIEHSLYRTMAELQRLRLIRQLDQAEEEPERDDGATPPLRAKQTQFARTPMKAKCLADTDLRENIAAAPAPKQSQSNPISPGHGAGRSQPTEAAVYSVATGAAGAAVMVLDRRKESS
jgi:hypothetical protein